MIISDIDILHIYFQISESSAGANLASTYTWCYRRLFSSLAACYFLLVLKVDIGHHPVGPLHHLAVAHTGGGEGRVDAGGAGALVAVRHETDNRLV